MSDWSSIRSWLRPAGARRGKAADRVRIAPSFRPTLEELETREAPGSLLGLSVGAASSLAAPVWSSGDLSSADPFAAAPATDVSLSAQTTAAPAATGAAAAAHGAAAGGAEAHATIGAGQAADPFALPGIDNAAPTAPAAKAAAPSGGGLSRPVDPPKNSGPGPLPIYMPIPQRPDLNVIPSGGSLPVVSPSAVPLSNAAWTQIGPAPIANGQVPGNNPVSGRVAGLAADPTNPNIIYLAAAGGGVWKTVDDGASWTPLTDNQATLFSGAIAIAPTNPNVLYVGTGESNNSGDSFYGLGVLVSTDAGATWTLQNNGGAFTRKTFSKIAVDPTNANTVYGAVAGSGVNGVGGNTGVWKSVNGGATWTNTTTAIPGVTPNSDFSDVVINATNPNQLFCAIGDPGGGAENGVYVSNNGGATWAAAGNFAGGVADGVIKIDISRSTPTTLYAAVATPAGTLGSIVKTVDGGVTWANTTSQPPDYMVDPGGVSNQGAYDNTIAIDPTNANVVFLGGAGDPVTAVQETTNGGTSWNSITVGVSGNDGPHADHHAMTFTVAGNLLDGNDGGIWLLQNANPATIAWTDLNGNLATLQDTGIALNPQNANIAYIGTQDNGTNEFTGSLPWTHIRDGDGGFVRVDPNNPLIVYHTYPGDGPGFIERSNDGGATWTDISAGINPGGTDASDFYVPYQVDQSNPNRLILGTDHLYETMNQGASWTIIATPGAAGFTTTGTIDAIGLSQSAPNTIYIADAAGNVFVTNNDGASWAQRNLTGVSQHINELVVDPTNSNSVYAVCDVFSAQGNVFHTANGGASWANISGNLPNLPTYSLALNTTNGAIYVGNDNGVFASNNAGASWSVFGTGMPNVQTVELEFVAGLNILAAGTHGRSNWEISTAAGANGGGGGGGGGGGPRSINGLGIGGNETEPEPNQTSDTATNFGPLTTGGTGSLSESIGVLPDARNDYDWFRWTAAVAGTFTAKETTTSATDGNLEMHLFTLRGNTLVQVAEGLTVGGGTQTLTTALSAGEVIFVEIKGENTPFGNMGGGLYNLAVSLR